MPKKSKSTVTIANQSVSTDEPATNNLKSQKVSTTGTQAVPTKNTNSDINSDIPMVDFAGLFEKPMEKDAVWDVIDAFFGQHNERQLIAHQYDSYQQL